MTTATEVATQIVASETDAVVAAAAAQTAVVAADAAVIMAEVQTAQVVAAAAAEIQEATSDVARLTEEVSWLRQNQSQTQAALEASNLATLEALSALQATVAELVLSKSGASTLSTQPESTLIPAVPVTEPSASAVVLPEAVAEPPAPAKPSTRLKRL